MEGTTLLLTTDSLRKKADSFTNSTRGSEAQSVILRKVLSISQVNQLRGTALVHEGRLFPARPDPLNAANRVEARAGTNSGDRFIVQA